MKESNQIFIGVDVGGTKIMTGAINAQGEIIGDTVKVPTNSQDASDVIVKRIIATVEDVISNNQLNKETIAGIGLGVTGPLDIDNGLVLDCPQLPTMHNFPLRDAVEDYFKVPTYMNNDANCMIYGETVFGAGQNKANVLGFTLGTGIGCGIILNGEILNGSTGNAAEIWKSPHNNSFIEDFVCGKGVRKIYKGIAGKEIPSTQVSLMAKEGDEKALETWKIFGEHLSVPISWAINFLDPEVIILGGSIAKVSPYFLEHTIKKVKSQVCSVPAEKLNIQLAKLGDYAGFIGAACLVLEHHNKEVQLT